ncbi:MAG TPA: DUF3710 domain-containing protein, partial [Pseudonocardia sp.]|nr:DUF3710 domain-containing protein [Pseudonocardia sp.]
MGQHRTGTFALGGIAVEQRAPESPRPPRKDKKRRRSTQGPYDGDTGEHPPQSVGVVDFGAVRVPVPERGTITTDPAAPEGPPQAVHIALPEGRLSVSALAAPKSDTLWPDLAKEIDASLREAGARVRSFPGDWGRELHATTGAAASLFVGVDGPRWMLYGVATGPTATAAALGEELRRVLRGTVVVRGRSPFPVRTVLPLQLPAEAGDGKASWSPGTAAVAADADGSGGSDGSDGSGGQNDGVAGAVTGGAASGSSAPRDGAAGAVSGSPVPRNGASGAAGPARPDGTAPRPALSPGSGVFAPVGSAATGPTRPDTGPARDPAPDDRDAAARPQWADHMLRLAGLDDASPHPAGPAPGGDRGTGRGPALQRPSG